VIASAALINVRFTIREIEYYTREIQYGWKGEDMSNNNLN
jgi:hypothetical protein